MRPPSRISVSAAVPVGHVHGGPAARRHSRRQAPRTPAAATGRRAPSPSSPRGRDGSCPVRAGRPCHAGLPAANSRARDWATRSAIGNAAAASDGAQSATTARSWSLPSVALRTAPSPNAAHDRAEREHRGLQHPTPGRRGGSPCRHERSRSTAIAASGVHRDHGALQAVGQRRGELGDPERVVRDSRPGTEADPGPSGRCEHRASRRPHSTTLQAGHGQDDRPRRGTAQPAVRGRRG